MASKDKPEANEITQHLIDVNSVLFDLSKTMEISGKKVSISFQTKQDAEARITAILSKFTEVATGESGKERFACDYVTAVYYQAFVAQIKEIATQFDINLDKIPDWKKKVKPWNEAILKQFKDADMPDPKSSAVELNSFVANLALNNRSRLTSGRFELK